MQIVETQRPMWYQKVNDALPNLIPEKGFSMVFTRWAAAAWPVDLSYGWGSSAHMIHVWYIYPDLVDFDTNGICQFSTGTTSSKGPISVAIYHTSINLCAPRAKNMPFNWIWGRTWYSKWLYISFRAYPVWLPNTWHRGRTGPPKNTHTVHLHQTSGTIFLEDEGYFQRLLLGSVSNPNKTG